MPFRADVGLLRVLSGLVPPAALLFATPALPFGLHPALTGGPSGLGRLSSLVWLQGAPQSLSEPLTGVLQVSRLLPVALSTNQELS